MSPRGLVFNMSSGHFSSLKEVESIVISSKNLSIPESLTVNLHFLHKHIDL